MPRTCAAASRRRPATAARVVELALDHVGRQLEVAGEVLEREVARLEHAGQPGDLALEVDVTLDVADRPVEQVLRVVDLPLAREIAVALEVLRIALEVAVGDRGGQRHQRHGPRRRASGAVGRRPAAGRLRAAAAHSATTS